MAAQGHPVVIGEWDPQGSQPRLITSMPPRASRGSLLFQAHFQGTHVLDGCSLPAILGTGLAHAQLTRVSRDPLSSPAFVKYSLLFSILRAEPGGALPEK